MGRRRVRAEMAPSGRVVMRSPVPKLAAALAFMLVAAPLAAEAQPAEKVPRVGVLSVIPLSSTQRLWRTFTEALRDLGYVDKQNFVMEWRWADGKPDRLADLAADLVRVNADVIVAMTNEDTLAAKRATSTIPIIMVTALDPVAAGLVASLARPGGNITGRAWAGSETTGKLIEILKETVPTITRVVWLRGAGVTGITTHVQAVQAGARALGLALREVELRHTDDMGRVLEEVRRWRPDAVYVGPSGIPAGHWAAILKFAVQHRLPALYHTRSAVQAGGLVMYAPSVPEMARRVAYYVDRILKGARPAELPVEQPQKFDLIINLKTARALGLTIPQSILLRADELIE